MISVVCVYNDANVYESHLAGSLRSQSVAYDLVPVDNRSGRFGSAATALNYGAGQACGAWVMFAHQDVRFLDSHWLRRAEELLEGLGAAVGWAGVVGVDDDGEFRGLLIDRDMVLGEPVMAPTSVQTLDECVLITRRRDFGGFDESLGGWHVYGVDVCCRARRAGRCSVVLPLLVHHDSPTSNVGGLESAHRSIAEKHFQAIGPIWTTCGRIDWAAEQRGPLNQLVSRVSHYVDRGMAVVDRGVSRFVGIEAVQFYRYGEVIEKLLPGEKEVTVLHVSAEYPAIEVTGLYLRAPRRRVVHQFRGLYIPPGAGAIVVSPALGAAIWDEIGTDVPHWAVRTVLCVPATVVRAHRRVRATWFARADRVAAGRSWLGGPQIFFFVFPNNGVRPGRGVPEPVSLRREPGAVS